MKIRQAVIPAAGLGTRFLPVTKAVPKELLPVLAKPCMQYVIDEAIASGIEEFIIVISKMKEVIRSYINDNEVLNKWLLQRGQGDLHEFVQGLRGKAEFRFVYQEEPLGLGDAVYQARSLVQDDYFFVILPDDIIDAEIPATRQMLDIFNEQKMPLVSVMEVPWDDVHRYGIVEARPLSDKLGDVVSIIEKPLRQNSPSNLAVIGRYILPKEIFTILQHTKPGAEDEIQLTDALPGVMASHGVQAYAFSGERYDVGTPFGFLEANLAYGLKHSEFKTRLLNSIKMLSIGM